MTHRIAPEAAADLDDIWYYTARESGSIEVADRLIDSLTDRIFYLATDLHFGRRRDQDLRRDLRSFPIGAFVILYRASGEDALILRIIRGSRDVPALLGY